MIKSIWAQNRKRLLWLGSIVGIGALVRLFRLAYQGLFWDEAKSWAVSTLTIKEMVGLTPSGQHPPLYFSLLKGILSVAPLSEATLRFPSVLFSVLALIVVMAYAVRRWNATVAAYAGWLMTLSSFDVYYAQETRMYTLLALLWTISYITLVNSLDGDQTSIVLWGLSGTLMPWVHAYGVVFAAAQVAFVAAFLALHFARRTLSHARSIELLAASAVIIAGTVPVVLLLWQQRSGGAGGGQIPSPQGVAAVFVLWSTGLTGARAFFLDKANLVLPPFAAISPVAWLAIGLVTSGLLALMGLRLAWRRGNARRTEAILTLWLWLAPMILAYGYGLLTNSPMWALRAFLGGAYLFYLWVGVGIDSLKSRWARRSVALVALLIALASLGPYFTTWQKSTSADAFRSLPSLTEQDMILLEPSSMSLLSRFYLGPETELWGLNRLADGSFEPARIDDSQGLLAARLESAVCEALSHKTDVWIYDYLWPGTKETLPQWPQCITEKNLWVFKNGSWQALQ